MNFLVRNGGEMKGAENTSAARRIAADLAGKSGEKSYIYRLPSVIEEVIYPPKKTEPPEETKKEPAKPKRKGK